MGGSSGNGPRGLGELLAGRAGMEGAEDSALGALARAARSRLALADAVRRHLPPDLAAAVANCNLRPDGTLMVTAASPEWAARLRFEADGILAACRPDWPAAERVRVRVGTDV
jgi:hypothetical protein